jgi:hydrogenase expression/formation protein HypE
MAENGPSPLGAACPAPLAHHARVLMAHGGGGRLMHRLIEQTFAAAFNNAALAARHDGALLSVPEGHRLAFTTDGHVVRPLFFPGGDIGSLAVNGTVNDLAMCGARPLALSAAFVLEEGFSTADLARIVESMRQAAAAVDVPIVTGDTKVVERGKGDGVFITTAGIGHLPVDLEIGPASVRPGDAVVLSGDIGRHGVAVLAAREELQFDVPIMSDCAPLVAPVMALLDAGLQPHCLRDLTRGGLATALVEIAETVGVAIEIDEGAIEVGEDVRGVCEVLGFDPLHLANEGRCIAILPSEQAIEAARILAHTAGTSSTVIGRVTDDKSDRVTMRTRFGASRAIDMLSGEQLPRIC